MKLFENVKLFETNSYNSFCLFWITYGGARREMWEELLYDIFQAVDTRVVQSIAPVVVSLVANATM